MRKQKDLPKEKEKSDTGLIPPPSTVEPLSELFRGQAVGVFTSEFVRISRAIRLPDITLDQTPCAVETNGREVGQQGVRMGGNLCTHGRDELGDSRTMVGLHRLGLVNDVEVDLD